MQPRLLIPFIQDRAHLFEQLPDPQLSMRLAADEHGRSGLQVRAQQRPAFLAARFPHMADSLIICLIHALEQLPVLLIPWQIVPIQELIEIARR
ncbi:MAG: hypothetical protein ACLVJ6_11710 [Merdibacter sp.]